MSKSIRPDRGARAPRTSLAARAVGLLAGVGGVVLGGLGPSPAAAAVYRCIDAGGGTTYTQTPCPVGATAAALRGVAATGSTTRDCRIARNFARRAASDMRAGSTSGGFLDAHGGLDRLSPLAIGIANYVWTFRGDTDTSVDRIATLAADRCTADSFGAADCARFPTEFIDGLGGCRAAAAFNAGVEDAWGDED